MAQTIKPDTSKERARWIIERDLSILTGSELLAKYGESGTPASNSFENITGCKVADIAPTHNPFWHYCCAVWFDEPEGAAMLHPPQHKNEYADWILKLVLGELDVYDGLLLGKPRRALKSTFMMAGMDWAAKRHKIRDGLDVIQFYVHNSEREAENRCEVVKRKNRFHQYIRTHFPQFAIPIGEWGNRQEWSWPCRADSSSVAEPSIKALSLAAKKAGKGAHYRWLDDCEDEDSRSSQVIREESMDQYDQLRALAAPAFSRECFSNTPYHLHGLTLKLKESKREDGTERYKVVWTPALTDDNEPNFPTIKRLTVAGLAKERANEISRTGNDAFWYLQYQLDPRMTGSQTMEWEWFQKMPEQQYLDWRKRPSFRVVLADTAWKGTENQGEGDDTVIGVVEIFAHHGRRDWVLLDAIVSRELVSDEGASEMCRLAKKWATHYLAPEMNGEKTIVGPIRTAGRQHKIVPLVIELGGFSKKHKTDRIMSLAGAARSGSVWYLESIPAQVINVLKRQVEDHPQLEHEDFLDMFANGWASEILDKWCPLGVPPPEQDTYDERRWVKLSRYSGLEMPTYATH